MKKTVVIDVVALSPRVVGEHTPFLSEWISRGKQLSVDPVLPAVPLPASAGGLALALLGLFGLRSRA